MDKSITAYYKGISFENEFAEHMKKDLNYDAANIRVSMSGKDNVKGVQADIIGVEKDDRMNRLRKAALYVLFVSILGTLFCILDIFVFDLIYFFAPLGLWCVIFPIIGRTMGDKYTWVECKNYSGKVSIKLVRNFYEEVKDHNASESRKFTVDKMIFVSANGYVENALRFAKHKGIECYIKNAKGKFEKIEWL